MSMMKGLFSGRRRSVFGPGRELGEYRSILLQHTTAIDGRLREVADDVDALRRRALDPDEIVARFTVHEEALDVEAEALREMLAPEELHGLHMEYEANLERALRGIVTVERGCSITRLPHRPPDDERPERAPPGDQPPESACITWISDSGPTGSLRFCLSLIMRPSTKIVTCFRSRLWSSRM